ncbi:hypothetical protein MCAP1_002074 [Malassezia caprae]|uniref:Major facilitator superfamily (MFS) profile domain-containing protein n=1 Tax=Malassezia caprae TaxID=1381934 RepID=A0AAF0E7S9_9BASI|nr:hypothetical protein MCAP1_002074 [Malassezia caprae]
MTLAHSEAGEQAIDDMDTDNEAQRVMSPPERRRSRRWSNLSSKSRPHVPLSGSVSSTDQPASNYHPVKYIRNVSQPAPALAGAWASKTATQAPQGTLIPPADEDNSSNPIKRALSDIHDAFDRLADEDAEDGARFEYRLAEAREALPDNVAYAEDIGDRNAPDLYSLNRITGGSIQTRRSSRTRSEPLPKDDTAKSTEQTFVVTFETTDSYQDNPRNWSFRYRFFVLLIYAMFSLTGPYASSMVSPAAKPIGKDLGINTMLEQNLLVGLYMLAYFVGPLFSAPMSEAFGRRYVALTCSTVFICFNIGCAVANTSTQMLALRFFSGMFSGAVVPMGGGSVSDMFDVHERGMSMAIYTIAPVLGPCIGPLVGGWIIQGWGEDKWRWIFWTGTFLAAFTVVFGFFFAPETYAPRILVLKARKMRKETGESRYYSTFEVKSETIKQKLRRFFLRPVILLCTEVAVMLPVLYLSVIYACFYLCIVSIPRVFSEKYQYRPGISALQNISLGLGSVSCCQLGGWFVDYLYKRLSNKHGRRRPEYKLPFMMVTVFVLPAAMILFGWTAQYRKVWIAPDIGLFFVGGAVSGSILQVQMYLADLMTIYAASAISASTAMRSLFAFLFLLFSNAMFDNLDIGWSMSLMALICAVIGIPSPFLLYRFGPYLRSKSKYCVQG